MEYEAVIGLEVHAELETESKMFCACPVVDTTLATPNTAVCPICAGMPGTLPVVNARAVEYAVRVALALGCEINPVSIFARKNYFYPDLPKGYQISQYEQPLARNGKLTFLASGGERTIRIRRVHLEEDTGKLTHVSDASGKPIRSLVDLNRAGIPLLEIVTEPDMHSPEEVRLCAMALRSVLRYVGVNSGDMQKGSLRIEPNISVRAAGESRLGTRTEIKNLNSFRVLERASAFEIQRHIERLQAGLAIFQETVGWDEARSQTFIQRVKEGEDDYRYFPDPDLPPLALDVAWVRDIQAVLPELPYLRQRRFQEQYGLNAYDAGVLTAERAVADYFEAAAASQPGVPPKQIANWISGELFSLLNAKGAGIEDSSIPPSELAQLVRMTALGEINGVTAKAVLAEMFATGADPSEIVRQRGLLQISDTGQIGEWAAAVIAEHPAEVAAYRSGKDTILRWLFGQVMRRAGGQANPQLVQQELERQLKS